jgi:hypothetical protein
MRVLGCWVLGLALIASVDTALAGVDMGLKKCDVHFTSDFWVKPSGVHSTQANRVYVLKRDGEVRVDGAQLRLSAQQRALVADYTDDLQAFMPALVAFVKDMLHTVGNVMANALAQALGKDSEPVVKVRQSLALSETRFTERLAAHPGEYRVVNKQLDVLDQVFDDDVENTVEDAIQASLGGVWSMLSSAIFSDEGQFDQRMADFGVKMARFGEQVERDMETQEPALEQRGEALCDRAAGIEQLEYRLRETIPELAHYRLLERRKKAREAAETAELRAR